MGIDYLIHIGIAAAAVLVIFMEGYRLGRVQGRGEQAKKESISRRSSNKKFKHEESRQERLMRLELENIENYATSAPQQEVR